jgi:hypothetical protein
MKASYFKRGANAAPPIALESGAISAPMQRIGRRDPRDRGRMTLAECG